MATIKHRRALKSQWTSVDPVLAAGELGFELDTNKIKIGNGLSRWEELTYFINEADVKSLIPSGGGGGTSIDDGDVSSNKTWSSEKINTSLVEKIDESQNVFVIMTEDGPINAATGEFHDIGEFSEDGISLQQGLMTLYQMTQSLSPKFAETKRLLAANVQLVADLWTPYESGFWTIDVSSGLNGLYPSSVALDEASTAGPVKFTMIGITSDTDVGINETREFEIPQNQKSVSLNLAADNELWLPGGTYRAVVKITSPGTNAKGLTIQAVRGSYE